MTDRELLELAAKAAGMKLAWPDDGEDDGPYIDVWEPWNPLTDDGDALRLAVKLCSQEYIGEWIDKHCTASEYNADPYAATRRAIVRAAAEIGKGLAASPTTRSA